MRFPSGRGCPANLRLPSCNLRIKGFSPHWGVGHWPSYSHPSKRKGRQRGEWRQHHHDAGGTPCPRGSQAHLFRKAIEMVMAIRLELACSKKEILSLYAAHAPFGGNVVGIEAASWRYFGRKLDNLSWAESAMLAVLPNNPSLVHPGRNRLFSKKKDRLLAGCTRMESLDKKNHLGVGQGRAPAAAPAPLPRHARHLLVSCGTRGHQQERIKSSIDEAIQVQAERVLDQHQQQLAGNQVFNAAAIILKVSTGEVLAYGKYRYRKRTQ